MQQTIRRIQLVGQNKISILHRQENKKEAYNLRQRQIVTSCQILDWFLDCLISRGTSLVRYYPGSILEPVL